MIESCILALTLILWPPQMDLPEIEPSDLLIITIESIAMQMEILDQRECRYMFMRDGDFTQDLRVLQDRYQYLKDAPPLVDCQRWPATDTLNENMSINRTYRTRVNMYMTPQNAQLSTEIISEVDRLYHIWDSARDVTQDYYYVTVRRSALKRLRDNLGEKDYYEGKLPPILPIQRFQEIKWLN